MVPDPPLPDQCTFAPVTEDWQVKKNDIVLCEPQPENILVENRVLWKGLWYDAEDPHEDSRPRMCYTIGNAEGVEDGWCYIEHMFGKLIDAAPRPRAFEWPEPLLNAPAA